MAGGSPAIQAGEPDMSVPRGPAERKDAAGGTGRGRLRLGYGTNGMGDHRLTDALALLADLGYDGVALTLDHHHLDPFGPGLARRVAAVARRLDRLGLAAVIETGARYLLDPWQKHQPTLLDDDEDRRLRRLDLLHRAIAIGADLGAEAVSFWSGTLRTPSGSRAAAWERLVTACSELATLAKRSGVRLGLEPEPGMLVETIADWQRLVAELGGPQRLGLTLDIGHCRCLEPGPEATCVRACAPWLATVQIDDMRRGVHEHLPFGCGEVDLPAVLAALREARYPGLVSVELPRHGHSAPALAEQSLRALRQAESEVLVP
jgi:sugar phosphate isomerase/epimerase